MDKYIFFFLPPNASERHPWDYVEHFLSCLVGVIVLFLFFKFLGINTKISLAFAAGALLALGTSKEIRDAFVGRTDMFPDMLANLLGIAVAILAIFLFARIAN